MGGLLGGVAIGLSRYNGRCLAGGVKGGKAKGNLRQSALNGLELSPTTRQKSMLVNTVSGDILPRRKGISNVITHHSPLPSIDQSNLFSIVPTTYTTH